MQVTPHTVCVVIPIYQTALTRAEQLALDQCLITLGQHPILVAKPATLNLSQLTDRYPQLGIEDFPDEYFRGIDGYNRLMLSDLFYARFSTYEFMLIYQLDAFVFKDQLLDWCRRGYDYIGAPWLPKPRVPGAGFLLKSRIKQRLYQWLDRKDHDHSGAHHGQYDYLGGNGGLSLRRIAVMRQTLQELSPRLNRYLARAHHTRNEDIFFCVEANRFRRHIRLAPLQEAIQFSWESHPATASVINHGQLPFGCHAWDKLHRDEWRPIFQSLGHNLDEILGDPPTTAS